MRSDSICEELPKGDEMLGWKEVNPEMIGGDWYFDIIDPQGQKVDRSRYGLKAVLKRLGVIPS